MECVTEANDVLRNGIWVQTNKGVELISFTDALTSGVGGLNLSVEDFQNVAAQLLSSSDLLVPSLIDSSAKLNSIAEDGENNAENEQKSFQTINPVENVVQIKEEIESPDKSSSTTVVLDNSKNGTAFNKSALPPQVKRKGGWPKGRKRKPELLNRPPKGPSTAYVFYLNEKRKFFKNTPFSEVTKLLGNEWSKLSLEDKKEYLERAELDKKRYREELEVYRKSEAYQSYLHRKRIKSLQANGTEESDIDAIDELDDEDNEELYCRSCDLWFVTLHNKREHLYGRQHLQSISQIDMHSNRDSISSSYDESSVDGSSGSTSTFLPSQEPQSVNDCIADVFQIVAVREKEIKFLKENIEKREQERSNIINIIDYLKKAEVALTETLLNYKESNESLEQSIVNLSQVPSLFVNFTNSLENE